MADDVTADNGIDEAARRRERYFDLIVEGNRQVRLVGSAERAVLRQRHWEESLHLGELIPLAGEHIVDLGSGAGFPGLPLAVANEGTTITLVESHGKKARFLRAAVEQLGLQDRVQVDERFCDGRTGIVAGTIFAVRALERMERVPGWLGRVMPPGARAAFWVTASMAETWRQRYPDWAWGTFSLLAGSRERGIVLSVPRGT